MALPRAFPICIVATPRGEVTSLLGTSSKMRKAMQTARDDLHGSGVHFAIEDDNRHLAEAYLPVFLRDIEGIMANLGG